MVVCTGSTTIIRVPTIVLEHFVVPAGMKVSYIVALLHVRFYWC